MRNDPQWWLFALYLVGMIGFVYAWKFVPDPIERPYPRWRVFSRVSLAVIMGTLAAKAIWVIPSWVDVIVGVLSAVFLVTTVFLYVRYLHRRKNRARVNGS